MFSNGDQWIGSARLVTLYATSLRVCLGLLLVLLYSGGRIFQFSDNMARSSGETNGIPGCSGTLSIVELSSLSSSLLPPSSSCTVEITRIQEVTRDDSNQGSVSTGTIAYNQEEGESSSSIRQRGMPQSLYNAARDGDKMTILVSYCRTPLLQARTRGGDTILHVHLANKGIKPAACTPDFIEAMLEKENNLLKARNNWGDTPFHAAARYNRWDALKYLIDRGGVAGYLSLQNFKGHMPVHLALLHKHPRVLRELLEADPTCSYITERSERQKLPLLAVESQCTQLVDMIYSITAVQAVFQQHECTRSPLHAAVSQRSPGMVRTVLEHDPGLVTSQAGKYRRTPVHLAAVHATDCKILEELLEKDSSVVNIRDSNGETAAHIAAQCNNVEALLKLKNVCPDCFETVDYVKRWNVAHHAASEGSGEALEYFIKEADLITLFGEKDTDGNTPIHLLAKSLPTLREASQNIILGIIPELKKMQLTVTNNDGHTPGDIADCYSTSHLDLSHQDLIAKFRMAVPPAWDTRERLRPIQHKRFNEAAMDPTFELKKMAKIHMVVAAVLAGASYAAELTPPGGFNQNDKDAINRGTVMLANKPAFEVFGVANHAAFISSLIALVAYLVVAIVKGKVSAKVLFVCGFIATSISMFALTVASMACVYSTQWESRVVAICELLISLGFMLFYGLLLIFTWGILKARSTLKKKKLLPL